MNPELGLYTFESKPTLPDEAALFGDVWRKVLTGDLIACIGEEAGKLIAVCMISRKGPHLEERHAGILSMAVHPDWRGRGLGSMLLSYLLRKCEGKFEIVQLTVVENNARARALYRKFGFVESGRLPRAFKRGGEYSDDLFMWRPVGGSTGSTRR